MEGRVRGIVGTLTIGMLACTGSGDGESTVGETGPPVDTAPTDGPACGDGAAFDPDSATICPGFAAVDFRIDDRVGRFGPAAVLFWTGAFGHDPEARTLDASTQWTPPFPRLTDDGPWTDGGHEPAGATANDGIWGYTGFFDLATLPGGARTTLEYGAVRDAPDGPWIWNRANTTNGVLEVGPDDDGGRIEPGDLVIPPFGDRELRFTLDSAAVQALDADENGTPDFPTWDPANGLRIKSPWWDWIEVDATPNGDNSQFSIELSTIAQDPSLRTGLAEAGAPFWFVLTLAYWSGASREYAVGGAARADGVTVEARAPSDFYRPVPITVAPFNDGQVLRVAPP